MNSHIRFLSIFSLLVAGLTSFAEEATVPVFESTPEKYVNRKEIGGVVAEPTRFATVTDELLVGDKSEDRLKFWFHLYGPNFHICGMAGTAVSVSASTYEYSEGKCQLRVIPGHNSVVIEDIGGFCKETHCGSRAYIGEVAFKKMANPPVHTDSAPAALRR